MLFTDEGRQTWYNVKYVRKGRIKLSLLTRNGLLIYIYCDPNEHKVGDEVYVLRAICPKGYFGNVGNGGVAECLLCPENTFQPLAGQFECLPCPTATFTEGRGKIDRSDCKSVTKPTRTNEEKSTAFQETNTLSKKQHYVVTEPAEIRKEDDDEGLGHVVTIGITFGCIAGLTLLFVLLLLWYRREKSLKKGQNNRDDSCKNGCSDNGKIDGEEELRTFNNFGYAHDSDINTLKSGSEVDNDVSGVTRKPKSEEKVRGFKFKLPFTKREYKVHQTSKKNAHVNYSKNRDSTPSQSGIEEHYDTFKMAESGTTGDIYSKKAEGNLDDEKEKPSNELQMIPIAIENELYGTKGECFIDSI
ncbi:uncharacterized protein LOC114534863 [Dendronephthya gigantea]|uniref:uncharacterized protein LOC114534863 n=1 Tax=Dendronephthya gigantea TaxID=151771 RepID=UPI00106D59D9|nr:uncharacterized protein LOC114534863 [Dendronephthya gigantea]